MQAHIYDKSRPENLPFLQKLRSLLNEYQAVSIGEVGADDSLAVMAEYTADGDKLHMAYSFNLLVPNCSSHYIRKQVENFEARVKGGWASWSVGNHDVQRVATRWGGPEAPAAFAKLALAMQLSLKGTPCLYQGDELAFAEADVPFELLQDPYGITFWPEFKGRDGCRTPMAWTGGAEGGFTTGKPWLPVSPDHLAKAASVQEGDAESSLAFTRKFIAWRRKLPQLTRGDIQFFDAPEPVLALRRDADGERGIIAVFNLGAEPASFALPQAAGAEQMEGYGLPGTVTDGQVRLPAFGAWFGYAS
jgi:alpha-glucosidase